jgi:acetyl esterase
LNQVHVEQRTIDINNVPNHTFLIRIYKPKDISPREKLPMMYHLHGGYWCAGDVNMEDFRNGAIISRGLRIIIVSFEYRIIPDVDWKTQFEDAIRGLVWVSEHAASLSVDVTKGF